MKTLVHLPRTSSILMVTVWSSQTTGKILLYLYIYIYFFVCTFTHSLYFSSCLCHFLPSSNFSSVSFSTNSIAKVITGKDNSHCTHLGSYSCNIFVGNTHWYVFSLCVTCEADRGTERKVCNVMTSWIFKTSGVWCCVIRQVVVVKVLP